MFIRLAHRARGLQPGTRFFAASAAAFFAIASLGAPSIAGAQPLCDPDGSAVVSSRAAGRIGLRAASGEFCRSAVGPHARVALVGDGPPELAATGIEEALRRSAAAWSSVGCSEATITYIGRVDSIAAACEAAAIPVLFRDLPSTEQVGSRLFEYDPDEQQAYNLAVLLNLRYEWSLEPQPFAPPLAPVFDVESVLVHELGHVLGLDHHVEDPLATMRDRYLRDGGLSSLAADDKLRLCEFFPGGPPSECGRDRDCRHGDCVKRKAFAVCEEERGEIGDYCALDLLYCSGGCHLSAPDTGDGYCTAPCQADEECGPGFFCEAIAPESTPEGDDATEEGHECRLARSDDGGAGCASAGRSAPAPSQTWWWLLGAGIWIRRVKKARRLT